MGGVCWALHALLAAPDALQHTNEIFGTCLEAARKVLGLGDDEGRETSTQIPILSSQFLNIFFVCLHAGSIE